MCVCLLGTNNIFKGVLFTFGAFLSSFTRYNLACHRLETLLQNIDLPPLNSANNAQYFLRKPDKVVEEDQRVFSAYQDCIQLQLQLNLAHHAVQRLRVSLGASRKSLPTADALEALELVHNSSTEQLRTIIRYLLDTLLSLLHSNNGEQGAGHSWACGCTNCNIFGDNRVTNVLISFLTGFN